MSYPILYSKNEGVRTPAIAGVAVAGLTIVGDDTEQKTAFTNQGLGTLSDAITCTVNEKRNGEYELEMQYPISGVHFSEIEQRSFILAKPNYTDDPQPFRVYKITKPLNGVCTIYARHISYDLSGFEMPAGRTASGLSATCTLLTKYASPFKITTTRSATGAFKTDVPATVRSWLGGKQGSVLDLFGGEWHWDRYECKLATNRGTNRGVTIRYGKNLTELTQETSCDNLYTKIRPYYVDADGNVISGHLVATGLHLDETRTLFLDCSEHFGTTVPTQAQLTSYAQTYAQANNLTVPDINITLDFVQLEGLAERVDLCDTVKVEYEALGVSATEKCIEVTWDVIRDRYSKAVFGSVKQNIADTVIKINEKAEEAVTPSVLEQSVERATSMITGNLGGYVVMHDSDGNGEPDEILIMNTPDINTATKVWRWNKNGLGYSSTGYDGTYGLAMTADGEIVADFITTGTMVADRIKGGTLTLGGVNDSDGILEVYDSANNLVAKLDKDGLATNSASITGGTINITTSSTSNDNIKLAHDNYYTSHTPKSFSVVKDNIFRVRMGLNDYDNPGIWFRDANGTERLRLISIDNDSNPVTIAMFSTSGNVNAFITSTSNQGGAFAIRDGTTDYNTVQLYNPDSYGGRVSVRTPDNKINAIMGSNANGGYFEVYNSTADVVTARMSQNANGGTVRLFDDTGAKEEASLYVNSNGGYLRLYDANGTNSVLANNTGNGGNIAIYNTDGTLRATLNDQIVLYNQGTWSIFLNGTTGEITCDVGKIANAATLSYTVISTF